MESFNKKALRLLILNMFLTMSALNQARAEDFLFDPSVGEKIAFISQKFLGFPYSFSPLGEGSGIDPDPLIRFDQFDCTTFVETMGALALAPSPTVSDALPILNQIRYYKGQVHFLNRNHFTSLEWVAHNTRAGLLIDATRSLFPEDYVTFKTQIDRKAWLKKNFSIESDDPVRESSLDVLPLVRIYQNPQLLQKIPQGAVINFILDNPDIKEKIGTDLDVAHQGLAIWKDDQLYLRHAKGKAYGVIEEPFTSYLQSRHYQGLYGISVTPYQRPSQK